MSDILRLVKENEINLEEKLPISIDNFVKVIKIDDKGRVNLTIKGVTDEDKAKLDA